MDIFDIGLTIFIALSGIIMLVYYISTGKPLKSAVIGAGSGAATLAAAKAISIFAGFSVKINIFTVLVSAILGIPGAVCTVILNVIFSAA